MLFGLGGGIQEMCYAALQEIVPIKHRILAIGCFEFGSGTIALLSPLIAYSILANASIGWRAVYWYIFAFEGFSLIMVVLFYRPPNFATKHRRDGKTKWQLVKQMDYVGFGLFTTGCVLFLVGVNWGGRQYAWKSAPVISTIVLGAALLVVLGFYEAYAPLQYPMLPTKFFKNIRGFTVLLVVCFVGGMLYYSMNVLWPRQSGMQIGGCRLPEADDRRAFVCATRQAHHRWCLRQHGVVRNDHGWLHCAHRLPSSGP